MCAAWRALHVRPLLLPGGVTLSHLAGVEKSCSLLSLFSDILTIGHQGGRTPACYPISLCQVAGTESCQHMLGVNPGIPVFSFLSNNEAIV